MYAVDPIWAVRTLARELVVRAAIGGARRVLRGVGRLVGAR